MQERPVDRGVLVSAMVYSGFGVECVLAGSTG